MSTAICTASGRHKAGKPINEAAIKKQANKGRKKKIRGMIKENG